MKKSIYIVISLLIMLTSLSIAQANTFNVNTVYAVNEVWQGRRLTDAENTTWQVQDYALKSGGCVDVADISCYEKKGKVRHLAQSLYFDEQGYDGIWVHFFAPKSVKNKGIVARIDVENVAKSPRYFCRGRLSRGGARRITTPISNQKTIDGAVNSSWAMMLAQTGSEIFGKQYEFDVEYQEGDAKIIIAKAIDGMVSHRTVVNDSNAISQIDFLDDEGNAVWIILNKKIAYSDGKWSPTEVFVINIKDDKASLLTKDEKSQFNKWPKSYNKKSLPCGR